MSDPCSVNWYALRDDRPPIWMAGGSCTKALIPGVRPSFRRSSFAISCAGSRSPRGFSVSSRRPELDPPPPPPPPPTDDITPAMLGSRCAMAAICCWCFTISVKEIPCAACVLTFSWPVSWSGMNPLGTQRKRNTVPTSTSSEKSITSPRRRIAQSSEVWYFPSIQSYAASVF